MHRVEHRFEIGRDHKGLSLLDYLDAVTGPVDRPSVHRAAQQALILLNGAPVQAGSTLREGDVIELALTATALSRRARSAVSVLYRDERLIVGDKPAGLAFDASRRGGSSAVEQLAEGLQGVGARTVHRLDKDTSGLVVLALSRETRADLLQALQAGQARMEYVAILRGRFDDDAGVVEVPLRRTGRGDAGLVPDPDHGTPCSTAWTVEERLRGFLRLRLIPRAGRSHQVRAHLAALGSPILCDRRYREDDRLMLSELKLDYRSKRGRPERPLLSRPALHAERFVWGQLEVRSPLPEDLAVTWRQLSRLHALP